MGWLSYFRILYAAESMALSNIQHYKQHKFYDATQSSSSILNDNYVCIDRIRKGFGVRPDGATFIQIYASST